MFQIGIKFLFKEDKTMTKEMIIDKFEELSRKSYKPSLKKYKEGHIFDENKSVKWNREEVIRQNNLFFEEFENLKKQEKKDWKELMNQLYSYLEKEYDLNHNQIEKLYSFAYEDAHSEGIRNVLIVFDELADLYFDLKNLE